MCVNAKTTEQILLSDAVLIHYLLLCNKLSPNLASEKTNFYSLTWFLGVRNLGMSWSGASGSGSVARWQSSYRLLQSLSSPKAWIGLEETLPCSFRQVLARRLSSWLCGLLMTLPPSEGREGESEEGREGREGGRREGGRERLRQKPQCLYNTVSEKTHHPFCCILLVTQISPSTAWGLYKGVTAGSRVTEGHLGLAYHSPSSLFPKAHTRLILLQH